MKNILLNLAFLFASLQLVAQTGQLTISRISQMPDLPVPLQIRDWNAVTVNYDSYVFDLDKAGPYLPLIRLGTQGQFNYPDNIPLFLDTYVGAADHPDQAEAINIIPAIVGASLAGIDKSNQNGYNWVAKTKDFYNLENGQNVYLNSYSATSGGDWWYDIMPNVYFYQLNYLYPSVVQEFNTQFTTVADQWLYCVNQLGGSTTPWTVPYMNYRAFNLATGMPLTSGVAEPESAGSIAWLLYNAYLETGSRKYFEGAQLAMDFLGGFASNPAYELQLPYGTLAAARMNAVEGTNYPLQKMLDWCFDRGALRGWGSITGNWGGYDVSGLIGEANDAGDDYAFIMNGFQQTAALAPLSKYDKRYARAIAKWILNVTNASRLFYWNSLPEDKQDSYAWASANDPDACLPHESMKEVWLGKTPYATGDAIRGGWAATNLSLYSGSSVGYMAAVVKATNIPEILQIDLNKTDFYGDNAIPAFLYFNPSQEAGQVQVSLPDGTFGVYEAISETVLSTNVSGTYTLSVPAGEVRLIRLFMSGLEPQVINNRLYAGDNVLDYHYQYNYSLNLRIKGLSTDQNPAVINSVFQAYCEPGNVNNGDPVTFEWYMDDVLMEGADQSHVQITAPGTPAQIVLKCRVTSNSQVAEDTLHIQVVDHILIPPVVNGIQAASKYTPTGDYNNFTALAEPAVGEVLEYKWTVSDGVLSQSTGNTVSWQAPEYPVVATITLQVTNQDMLSTTVTSGALVKNTALEAQTPLIWYPFDWDDLNHAADRFHATVSGVSKTTDARGELSMAYRFTTGSNIIYTANHNDLNFSNAVSLSCWIKCEQLGSERFIISHGSWQQRYKLSVTPEGYLRWTVKTSSGVSDLDGSAPIELNRYYHVTAIYTGFSMELYIDGELDTYKSFSGDIQPSTLPLTIGRMDNVEILYSWLGSIDEVKLWNTEIPISQVAALKTLWSSPIGIEETESVMNLYPNPARDVFYIEMDANTGVKSASLCMPDGREVLNPEITISGNRIKIEILRPLRGLHLLKLIMNDGRVIIREIILQ